MVISENNFVLPFSLPIFALPKRKTGCVIRGSRKGKSSLEVAVFGSRDCLLKNNFKTNFAVRKIASTFALPYRNEGNKKVTKSCKTEKDLE